MITKLKAWFQATNLRHERAAVYSEMLQSQKQKTYWIEREVQAKRRLVQIDIELCIKGEAA